MRSTGLLVASLALPLLACVAASLAVFVGPARGAATVPPGFTQSPVVEGLTDAADMEFAPDGRMFVAQNTGKLLIAKPDGTLVTFLDISAKVDSASECGLLGLTFDPGFVDNRYVYLSYTRKATATTPAHNRVVRVTAGGDKAVAGSEKLIFRLNNQGTTCHMGGAIDFANDGKLYVSTGDNGAPDKAQTLTNLYGKVLRINKDGTIPTSNPFYSTAAGNNRAIWTYGLRNPFKLAIKPGTSIIFVNDVGENTWEEINRGAPGANYGWPKYEGPESDAKYVPPLLAYSHEGVDPTTTGCSITGGTFYDPITVQFPSSYVGDYFFADFCNGWIRTYEPATNTASGFATGLGRVVDLEVDKDSELYILSRGGLGSVDKISYTGT